MPAPIRLWIETTYHAAFRYGGWAYARDVGGAVTGVAGGERNTTAQRIGLGALIAGLEGLPMGSEVAVRSASPALLAAGRLLMQAEAPAEDLDLWARLDRLAAGRAIMFKAAAAAPQTPAAFLAAWAEVGQDKAKAPGRFAAAIPRSNLAKLKLD
jgi:hypothetical protein